MQIWVNKIFHTNVGLPANIGSTSEATDQNGVYSKIKINMKET